MVLEGIFGKRIEEGMDDDTEDFVEVSAMETMSKTFSGKIGIKVEKLNEFADTERILRSVRRGNVVFLKIKGLKEKDMGELKRAVEKLKKTVVAGNGDIAGIEQDWLVLTPQDVTVERE